MDFLKRTNLDICWSWLFSLINGYISGRRTSICNCAFYEYFLIATGAIDLSAGGTPPEEGVSFPRGGWNGMQVHTGGSR